MKISLVVCVFVLMFTSTVIYANTENCDIGGVFSNDPSETGRQARIKAANSKFEIMILEQWNDMDFVRSLKVCIKKKSIFWKDLSFTKQQLDTFLKENKERARVEGLKAEFRRQGVM